MADRTKAMTLRLPAEVSTALQAIAAVDQMSVAQEVREAIAAHIESRRQDAAFQEKLRRLIDENQEVLSRLAQ